MGNPQLRHHHRRVGISESSLMLSLKRSLERSISLPDRLREFLEENSSLSPEAVAEIFDELDVQKKVDTDGGIRLLYTALEHFAGRFAKEPLLREHTKPLLTRLEALEKREADEFEKELVARFRVKPGEIDALYDWGRGLLKE